MINKPQTFIFAGRSGCGKGTQLKLLRDYLTVEDKYSDQFAFSTGDAFRNFFIENTYASNIAKEITQKGELQPLFLTISLWGNAFLKDLKEDDHIFIDGYPRVTAESIALDSALKFFKRDDIIIIDFIVSRETSKQRMLSRGRNDDTKENIETRLDWYDRDVTPAVNYLKNQPGYIYLTIDGEKTIEEIHADIINKVSENCKVCKKKNQ